MHADPSYQGDPLDPIDIILGALTKAGPRSAPAAAATASGLLAEFDSLRPSGSRAGGKPSVPSTDLLDRYAEFLAQKSTGAALKTLWKTDKKLRSLKPPAEKAEVCDSLSNTEFSVEVNFNNHIILAIIVELSSLIF